MTHEYKRLHWCSKVIGLQIDDVYVILPRKMKQVVERFKFRSFLSLHSTWQAKYLISNLLAHSTGLERSGSWHLVLSAACIVYIFLNIKSQTWCPILYAHRSPSRLFSYQGLTTNFLHYHSNFRIWTMFGLP